MSSSSAGGIGHPKPASDEVKGVQYQRVKLDVGADGETLLAAHGRGVSGDATVRVTLDADLASALEQLHGIRKDLQRILMHLSMMTDVDLESADLEM